MRVWLTFQEVENVAAAERILEPPKCTRFAKAPGDGSQAAVCRLARRHGTLIFSPPVHATVPLRLRFICW
jgi:hypothetical protein